MIATDCDDKSRGALLRIGTGEVHLWFCPSGSSAIDASLLRKYAGLLDSAERERERRFVFERDRRRHRITRALVRTVLSHYAPIVPTRWIFEATSYGRPQIANSDPFARSLSFNVSHTDGMIAIAVAHDCALGVDTENVLARTASLDVARHFFARAESEALERLPEEQRHRRFFEYWTLKEAYIKARGMGLSIPLDKFSFDLSRTAGIGFRVAEDQADRADAWNFQQFWITRECVLALCHQRRARVSRLIARSAVPLLSEAVVALTPTRRSSPVDAVDSRVVLIR